MCSCNVTLQSGSASRALHTARPRLPIAPMHRRHCFRDIHAHRPGSLPVVRASDEDKKASGSDSTESLFMKELQKRGLTGASKEEDEQEKSSPTSTSTQPPKERKSVDKDHQPPAAPRMSQLDKSRALNSEGVEGLIPRLTELSKLGLTFFLAFGPLVLITVALFGGLFALFGDEFVHGGRHLSGIPYVDPYELLDEPTVDPMVPFADENFLRK